jgi:hypothetical protein
MNRPRSVRCCFVAQRKRSVKSYQLKQDERQLPGLRSQQRRQASARAWFPNPSGESRFYSPLTEKRGAPLRGSVQAQTGGWTRLEFGQSMSALPEYSDVNLFCYRQSIVYFDAKISNRAFDRGVTE